MCQKIMHNYKGCFTCSEVVPDLWYGYEQYQYDFETYHEFWQQQCDLNECKGRTHFGQAIATM